MPEPSRLFLVRHAHAQGTMPGERDFDRQLDARGREEAEIVCRQAETLGIAPDLIISSAARRCQETSAILKALTPGLAVETDDTLYAGTADAYLALIARRAGDGDLMIVGHNPMMEELAERLFGRDFVATSLPWGFPTACLLAGRLTAADPGSAASAEPLFLVTPSFSERY